MASVKIEVDGAREIAVDMRNAEPILARRLKPAVSKGALNVKNDLAAEMRKSKSFGMVAKAISYDLDDDGYGAEIGPEKGAPGSLANIAYFGATGYLYGKARHVNPGGGTVEDPVEALHREEQAFADALADIAADML